VFGPNRAWHEIHQGADLKIPRIFKHVMTYVTPLYLAVILVWWAKDDALPIILNHKSAGSASPVVPADEPYIWGARVLMVAIVLILAVLVRWAWRRNGYDSRQGFVEVGGNPAASGGIR